MTTEQRGPQHASARQAQPYQTLPLRCPAEARERQRTNRNQNGVEPNKCSLTPNFLMKSQIGVIGRGEGGRAIVLLLTPHRSRALPPRSREEVVDCGHDTHA